MADPTTAPSSTARRPRAAETARPDAESMAKSQREISVSEFFAKNRHLLGFDNPRKALLTTVKEAVDNALDACEEAHILPDLFVGIEQLGETRFRITIRDNGPGIVRKQVENVFGKLLYGSKFHRLKMSRGQQGIGIAASGMYGLMTTGKPMVIHTKPKKNKPCHRVTLAIDTQKNKADVSDEIEMDFDLIPKTGTQVEIELEGRYQRGRQSVDEYLKQTAIANPHAQIIFQPPDACRPANTNGNGHAQPDTEALIDDQAHAVEVAKTSPQSTVTPGGTIVHPRGIAELPEEPKEIKPHPRGIEMGTLQRMLKTTQATQLGAFLQSEFCRVSTSKATEICDLAGKLVGSATITNRTYCSRIKHAEAEAIYQAIQEVKLMSPPTDCLAPIGAKQILAGLLKGEKAEFYTANTRDPAVYRGNPFQIEVGLAFGGSLPGDEPGRVIRFANRVPLLYQQSACAAFKAVADTGWRNYNLSQPRGALPVGPLVIMIHMASVWVPFTSESKEAIADYDEIRKEMKLALSECGRKLKIYLSRRARMRREGQRRDIFTRYIGEVVRAINSIDPQFDPAELHEQFVSVARTRTAQADVEFDEDGNPIKKKKKQTRDVLAADETTVIVEDETQVDEEESDEPSAGTRDREQAVSDEDDEGSETLF
ncbi:MAG: DNA topoisomerase VI subunit B [Phycisphaeraceae bacterium]